MKIKPESNKSQSFHAIQRHKPNFQILMALVKINNLTISYN